jgi:hypothetical protein
MGPGAQIETALLEFRQAEASGQASLRRSRGRQWNPGQQGALNG